MEQQTTIDRGSLADTLQSVGAFYLVIAPALFLAYAIVSWLA